MDRDLYDMCRKYIFYCKKLRALTDLNKPMYPDVMEIYCETKKKVSEYHDKILSVLLKEYVENHCTINIDANNDIDWCMGQHYIHHGTPIGSIESEHFCKVLNDTLREYHMQQSHIPWGIKNDKK